MHNYKVGPILVITRIITPLKGVKKPQANPFIRLFIRIITPFITGSGAHLVTLIDPSLQRPPWFRLFLKGRNLNVSILRGFAKRMVDFFFDVFFFRGV